MDAKYVAGLGVDHVGKIIFDSEPTLRGFAIRVRLDHNKKAYI